MTTPLADRSDTRSDLGRGLLARQEGVLAVVGSLVVALGVIGMFQLTWRQTVEFWGPVLVLTTVVVVTTKLIRDTAAMSDVPRFSRILWWGLAAKGAGTGVRYYVTNFVYDGGDEVMYNASARLIAVNIREGMWSLADTPIEPHSSGTQAIGWLLSTLYSVVGYSELLGYGLFSWMSWVGLMCFYRAFRTGVPDVPSKLYAYLIFFLPTLIYWPSSTGKEAFMIFLLGLATLGLTKLVNVDQPVKAVVMVALGAAGLSWVRPHMALLLLASSAVGLLVRNPNAARRRGGLTRALVMVIMVPGLFVAVGRVDQFFGGSGNWVEAGTEQTTNQTATGGSVFESKPVRNPADLPLAAVSVTMRPFAWEAGSIVSQIASLEGVFLAGLVAWRWRVLGRLVFEARRRPLVAFAVTYVVLFVIAFSNINNEGILVRQRTQMFPYLLMAFAVAGETLLPAKRRGLKSPDVDGETEPSTVSQVPRTVPGARSV